MIYKSLVSCQLECMKLKPHMKTLSFLISSKVFNLILLELQSILLNFFILNLSKMAKVFSNKNFIYYIIRQQWFNKISSEKLSDFNWRFWVNQERALSSFFHQIKFIVFKKVWLEKGLLSHMPHHIFFHRYILYTT